ncbi:hypothetical protein A6E01_20630 (plasmid) [Vibrio breoganii]|uniref:Membrane-bound lytic murein transglycosylase MltC n=1 Tax=Vibrio breoganii TaxID=553239 RepID=A0AAN1CUK0_9VIBR|nr:murein transglycosylase domain-containing protein [Vibrio breoganii]ANO35675.1 hypothetical protein A6E01_20630 [Vibrio breoganii]
MKVAIWVLLVTVVLAGCSREFIEEHVGVRYTLTNKAAMNNLAPLPGKFELRKDDQGTEDIIFVEGLGEQWRPRDLGPDAPHHFIKYTNNYHSKSDVNFQTEMIKVSTIHRSFPRAALRDAIITTLLTPANPDVVEYFDESAIELGGEPFLYGRVRDHEGNKLRWEWRTRQYADYLIERYMKTEIVDFHTAHYVEFPFRYDGQVFLSGKDYKYADLVRKAAKEHQISEALIYAIIKTESSFNPYAVSWAGAFGLMQVIPSTAGTDVYKLMKGRSRPPTKRELMTPAINVDVGTSYLWLLKNRYLAKIENPIVRQYAMISAYNGGTGGVFRAFGHRGPAKAIEVINKHTPESAYKVLRNKHPNAEARGYIYKVLKYKNEFKQSLDR